MRMKNASPSGLLPTFGAICELPITTDVSLLFDPVAEKAFPLRSSMYSMVQGFGFSI
jgi:hypothetical protein